MATHDFKLIPAEELEQGSLEWHTFRAEHLPASEVAAAMGISPFFPKTPAELNAVRTGEAIVEETMPMRRGKELEPIARAAVNEMYNREFLPAVVSRQGYGASLDGVDFTSVETCDILELKCPLDPAKLFAACDGSGEFPKHYWYQMCQQAWCLPIAVDVIFAVYDGETGDIRTITIDAQVLRETWEAECKPAWEAFLGTNHEPIEIDQAENDKWCEAARKWDDAKRAVIEAKKAAGIAKLEKAEKDAKAELIAVSEAGIPNVGHGIRVGWSEVEPSMRPGYVTKRVTGKWED